MTHAKCTGMAAIQDAILTASVPVLLANGSCEEVSEAAISALVYELLTNPDCVPILDRIKAGLETIEKGGNYGITGNHSNEGG